MSMLPDPSRHAVALTQPRLQALARPPGEPADELAAALRAGQRRLAQCALFSVVASLLVLVPSWYMLEVYERVINSRSASTLAMLTLLVLVAYAVMELLEWAQAEQMRGLGVEFDAALGERVQAAAFRGNLRGIAGAGIHPLNDLRTLREFFVSPLLRAALEAPVALVLLVVLYWLHPALGWAAAAGAALLAVVAWANEKRTHRLLRAAAQKIERAQTFADGALRHAVTLAAMGMGGALQKRWAALQAEALEALGGASERAAGFSAFSRFVQLVMASLLLGLGAWLVLRNELPTGPGGMIVASILGGRALRPLVQGVTHWRGGVAARDAWRRLHDLLAAVPAPAQRFPLPRPAGMLTAEAVTAAPPGAQQPVVRGVTLGLNPGEMLAVVGASGSGKSSLARVLMGLWPSSGGKARLDGVDLHAWSRDELAAHVGYLPQDVELFAGSVADNIARFGPADEAGVLAAAQAAGAHEMIEALPDGYRTEVGSDGQHLSAGQRQRVGLARALFGQPVLVVLDEPDAHLDEAGEAALRAAVAAAKARGTTFVVVTHRQGLLQLADKVLVLQEGTPRAFGPRDAVLEALRKAREAAARPRALHAPMGADA